MIIVNVLNAIMNIAAKKNKNISDLYLGPNRINNEGEALEYFLKDAYCNSFHINEKKEKEEEHDKYLSHTGDKNNPPDFIVRGGEAVDVKKIKTYGSILQLNSSNPRNKLSWDDPKLSNKCRECEGIWEEKSLYYGIGVVKKSKVKLLWLIDGECYAANNEVYSDLFKEMKGTIDKRFPMSKNKNSRELGVLQRIDQRQRTNLRIRAFWTL